MNHQLTRRALLATLSSSALVATCANSARAEDSLLLATQAAGGTSRKVSVLLEIGGDLKLNDQGTPRTLKMSVTGRLSYVERLLEVGELGVPRLAARRYETADAVLKIDRDVLQPQLRSDRRMIGSNITKDQSGAEQAVIFSPEGPLTRQELDLLEVPANSLLVDRLLPGRELALRDKWQHTNDLLAPLFGLDAVSESDVFSEFAALDEESAQIELAGTVHGAIHGVATELKLKGRYKFNRQSRQVTWLALLIDEKRSIGHVGPGADVTSRLQMTLDPVTTPEALNDAAIESGVWDQAESLTLLEFRSPQAGFTFHHDRRWHVMDANREAVALRLIERGELVAQCNITSLPPVSPGKMTTLDEFQRDIQRTLAKNFGKFVSAAEGASPRGYQVHRVVVSGAVSDLPIQWHYYLVGDREGHQVVLAFTIENEQLARLAETDQAIAGSVELSTPTETVSTPKTTR